MRKILTAVFLFAGLALLLPALGFFSLRSGAPGRAPQTAPNAPSAPQAAAGKAQAAAEAFISGQALYDARAALPPQALLEVKLTETDKKTHISRIAAETRLRPDGTSPLNWTLPIKLSALNSGKDYSIQAKISSGDSLLFVNAAPTAPDMSRAAYIIRLAQIDDGSGGKTEARSLIGVEWRAAALGSKNIEPNSVISLTVDNAEKTDPASGDKSYQAGGSTGCNRYQTAAVLNESKKSLKFAPIIGGFIACGSAIARQETDFIAVMDEVRSYKIDESGALYLLDGRQNTLARFTARPQ